MKDFEKYNISSFPKKLYMLIMNPVNNYLINWLEDGTKFIVFNPSEFTLKLLNNKDFSNAGNYASFIRQLNMYDFHKEKTKEKANIFFHKYFIRGNIELLQNIKRKKTEIVGKRKKSTIHQHSNNNTNSINCNNSSHKYNKFDPQLPSTVLDRSRINNENNNNNNNINNNTDLKLNESETNKNYHTEDNSETYKQKILSLYKNSDNNGKSKIMFNIIRDCCTQEALKNDLIKEASKDNLISTKNNQVQIYNGGNLVNCMSKILTTEEINHLEKYLLETTAEDVDLNALLNEEPEFENEHLNYLKKTIDIINHKLKNGITESTVINNNSKINNNTNNVNCTNIDKENYGNISININHYTSSNNNNTSANTNTNTNTKSANKFSMLKKRTYKSDTSQKSTSPSKKGNNSDSENHNKDNIKFSSQLENSNHNLENIFHSSCLDRDSSNKSFNNTKINNYVNTRENNYKENKSISDSLTNSFDEEIDNSNNNNNTNDINKNEFLSKKRKASRKDINSLYVNFIKTVSPYKITYIILYNI